MSNYSPIYCTKEGIARKLRSRLNIKPDQYTAAPYQQSLPSISVDDELTDQIIEQTEDFLNLILAQMYELPLSYNHPILTNIVESLVCSELLRIHFIGQGISSLSSDISGTSTDTKQYAYSLLNMLVAGTGIMLPGMPQVPNIPGNQLAQPLRLPGETRRRKYQDNDLLTEVYTYIQQNSKTEDAHRRDIKDICF